jgi:hypothetical protein
MPRLKDGGSEVRFQASGQAVTSAGPNLAQARAHLVGGKFGSAEVILEIASPRKEAALAVHAAAHIQSGNPPRPDVKYHIDVSSDGGKTWKPMVRNWTITRRGDEPKDFWSQSFCWGSTDLGQGAGSSVRVRFRNDGGKPYARCEAHLVYRVPSPKATKVTFDWIDDSGTHQESHDFPSAEPAPWKVPTGRKVETKWVEMEAVQSR